MKPFKLLTPAEQRVRHAKLLDRSYKVSRNNIWDYYSENFEKIGKLREKISNLSQKINDIEDRVANKADKEYKGWNVWRSNKKFLKEVVHNMDIAGQKYRMKIDEIEAKIKKLVAPYDKEIAELDKLHNKLMQDVK